MRAVSSYHIDSLLRLIEEREHSSLVWGYVDGGLSSDEVLSLASEKLGLSNEDAEVLFQAMLERGLLFEVTVGYEEDLYRTRFGEGARLLSRLRQLFPTTSWQNAPNLVSDFRIDCRPRRFPSRNIKFDKVLESVSDNYTLSGDQKEVLEELICPGGQQFELAKFQLDAINAVLSGTGDSGMIVTAGTGSGKTYCFYLPVFLKVYGLLDTDGSWTKVLAIYPRNELLKDQLAETLRLATQVKSVLVSKGKRPITIGTLFGSTPISSAEKHLKWSGWKRRGSNHVCPYLLCPSCSGDLLWGDEDRKLGKEKLNCQDCDNAITESEIFLTRERILKSPPDFLFTTTEMLNKRLADRQYQSLFGINISSSKKPRYVLLDEVHTYTGTSGAQAGLTFRRWRHALKKSVYWVGLSATLRDAASFFSSLTGVQEHRVSEVCPLQNDMEEKSAEYQFVLRGDAVSQSSLLSTSIQASFLIGRLLDSFQNPISEGYYGQRVFAFTDNLDVTNRLFDNLRDAEAYDIFGRPDLGRAPLASLRGPEQTSCGSNLLKNIEGQRWKICEDLGRDLSDRLNVGRTTSKDTGVSDDCEVVVATAALEVGFNDPRVGAVIQHKAPRNFAAYVQRKGRAGRSREMRPWMVTVLSDYGQDRIAFQNYDHLFDPELPRQSLPIKNQYVLRMQAVMVLFDWLSFSLPNKKYNTWVWKLLSEPNEYSGAQEAIDALKTKLNNLIKRDPKTVSSFTTYLQKALALEEDEVKSLLWAAPRSLMLEAVPTLLRRVATNWDLAKSDGTHTKDVIRKNLPLPEFVPENLFSELTLPAVKIHLPPATSTRESTEEDLPLVQAMRLMVPGRVTRRFATERGGLSHWIPVPIDSDQLDLAINDYSEVYQFVGDYKDADAGHIEIYRPWEMKLQKVEDSRILPTSNAMLVWKSQFQAHGTGVEFQIPAQSNWGDVFASSVSFSHAYRSAVSTLRYSLSAEAEVRLKNGKSNRVDVQFSGPSHKPCGIGFEQEVDGIRLRYRLPAATHLSAYPLSNNLMQSLRRVFFKELVLTDDVLSKDVNFFQRDWIQQIYFASLLLELDLENPSLEVARNKLHRDQTLEKLQGTMEGIFRISPDVENEDGNGEEHRLQQKLVELFSDQSVLSRVFELAENLWDPDSDRWGEWLRSVLHESVGQASLMASMQSAPRHASIDSLVVDPVSLTNEEEPTIYISETTLGGAGVIESITEKFAEDPYSFFCAFDSALVPGDMELASIGMRKILTLSQEDSEVSGRLNALRNSRDAASHEAVRESLFVKMRDYALPVTHTLSIFLHNRLLRPKMNEDSDQLLFDIYRFWDDLENSVGVKIEVRLLSVIASTHQNFKQRLSDLGFLGDESVSSATQVFSSLLWPKSWETRQYYLNSYNPFRGQHFTDPHLVREILMQKKINDISIESPDWEDLVKSEIEKNGRCRLICPPNAIKGLRSAIIKLQQTPFNIDYLQFYTSVESFEVDDDLASVTIYIRELF